MNQDYPSLLNDSAAGSSTIEGYLTKVSKTINPLVGSDFDQSRLTKNFFEDNERGKTEDGQDGQHFPTLTNVGPQVTTRPAPSLDVPPDGQDPQTTLDDAFKQLKRETLVNVFQAHGMDYDHQNVFVSDCQDMGVGQISYLTSDQAASKMYPDTCPTNGGAKEDYAQIQMRKLRDGYDQKLE